MKRLGILALGSLLIISCGGKSSDKDSSTIDSSGTEAPTTTLAPLSELEYLTNPVEPMWSVIGNTDFISLTKAQDTAGDSAAIGQDLFGQPFEVPTTNDALFRRGSLWITKSADDTWNAWSQVEYATMIDVASLETAVSKDFKDDRFVPGVRVESEVGDGIKVITLNFPATTEAAVQGWETMTISIGPELSGLDPTGRNAIEVRWEQNVEALNEIAIPAFLRGWLAELPIPSDIDVAEFHASTSDLETTSVNIEAKFTTNVDRFEELATYFAQERSSGQLILEQYTLPSDLSTVNEIDFGFFPKLADNDLTVEISRDLANTSAPMSIRLGIDIRLNGEGDY